VDQRDRIFDRFQRTDTARARAGGGAGLGLAIARAIVEAHAGRIYAGESTAGGARVAFELPGYARAAAGGPARAGDATRVSARRREQRRLEGEAPAFAASNVPHCAL